MTLDQFKDLLQRATAGIPEQYFRLRIAGANMPVFRERVYCYELYHQLRSRWPDDYLYSLGGEVDKSGHPLFRGGLLEDSKPDFLVHNPGDMEGNFIVIEVKAITARPADARDDITTLKRFVDLAGYKLPIFLLFGGTEADLRRFTRRALSTDTEHRDLDPVGIELWWHPCPGEPARKMPWR